MCKVSKMKHTAWFVRYIYLLHLLAVFTINTITLVITVIIIALLIIIILCPCVSSTQRVKRFTLPRQIFSLPPHNDCCVILTTHPASRCYICDYSLLMKPTRYLPVILPILSAKWSIALMPRSTHRYSVSISTFVRVIHFTIMSVLMPIANMTSLLPSVAYPRSVYSVDERRSMSYTRCFALRHFRLESHASHRCDCVTVDILR